MQVDAHAALTSAREERKRRKRERGRERDDERVMHAQCCLGGRRESESGGEKRKESINRHDSRTFCWVALFTSFLPILRMALCPDKFYHHLQLHFIRRYNVPNANMVIITRRVLTILSLSVTLFLSRDMNLNFMGHF